MYSFQNQRTWWTSRTLGLTGILGRAGKYLALPHIHFFRFRIGPLTPRLTKYTEAANIAPSAILAMDVAIALKIGMVKILLPILDVLRDEQDY